MKLKEKKVRSIIREEIQKVLNEHEPKKRVKDAKGVNVYESRPKKIEPGVVWNTIFGNWRASAPENSEFAGYTAGFKEDMYGAVHFARTGEDLHKDHDYLEKLYDKGFINSLA